ncbi:hypothetical protein ACFE04_002551 [Oxalis oulophora]
MDFIPFELQKEAIEGNQLRLKRIEKLVNDEALFISNRASFSLPLKNLREGNDSGGSYEPNSVYFLDEFYEGSPYVIGRFNFVDRKMEDHYANHQYGAMNIGLAKDHILQVT